MKEYANISRQEFDDLKNDDKTITVNGTATSNTGYFEQITLSDVATKQYVDNAISELRALINN